MTWKAAVDALALQIEALDHFDDANVSVGDWKTAAEGHNNAVVLEYVRFEAERITADPTSQITWLCRIHLLVEYREDDTAHKMLADRRDELVLNLLQNPTIAGAAFDVMVISGEADPDEIDIGEISFLKETIDVEIEEQVSA